ncbi:MAG: substrate-binding domain-containing protein [Lachnospiraceae bacterium]|nr:substrate-binding domain-containing protein [Lachnospiraceae bacterium]
MLEGIKKLRVIGLIIEEIHSDFARDMIRSIQGAMTQHDNLRLIVLEGKRIRPEESDNVIAYNAVYNTMHNFCALCDFDGFIIHPGSLYLNRQKTGIENEKIRKIPKVYIAANMDDEVTVNFDNESGIREAVDYLINAKGCTNICMLGGRDNNIDAALRKRIFMDCLAENEIPFSENKYQRTDMSEFCVEEAGELLDRNPGVEAIFCVNDASAKGLYQAMKQRNLEPGRDVYVFGFDNTHLADELQPTLSSIGAYGITPGAMALELLVKMMDEEEVHSELIPTRLYGRESYDYEMYDDSLLGSKANTDDYVNKMFDECFYRYKNITFSREIVNLKKLFGEIGKGIFDAIRNSYLSPEDSDVLERKIDRFFEKGAMEFTDAAKFLRSIEKMQMGLNMMQCSSGTKMMISKLFMRMKDRAIINLSLQKVYLTRIHNIKRNKLQDFLVAGTVYAENIDDGLQPLVKNLSLLGLENSILYIFDEHIKYKAGEKPEFPEMIRLRAVIRNGEMFIPSKERMNCLIKTIFFRDELGRGDEAYALYPLFCSNLIYGVMLSKISNEIFDRGEFLAMQLSRTLYINDMSTQN